LTRFRTLATMVASLVLLAPAAGAQGQPGPQVPAPRGYVNDFANVIPAVEAARMERLIETVRSASGGEIAVVTLADLEGRDVGDVALRIGRDWGVGSNAAIGERARNAGVVVLLVPRETSQDGRGHISIQTGQGAEGFITDGTAGDIRREATPLLARGEYGPALTLITARLAERYAAEFGFALDSAIVPPRAPARRPGIPPVVFLIIFIVLVSLISRAGRRGRRGVIDPADILLGMLLSGGRRRGGWGGGGFGGGGFGGGGFGGFGGGGGFSGGGSSGSF
jgi:uncharacterized protein